MSDTVERQETTRPKPTHLGRQDIGCLPSGRILVTEIIPTSGDDNTDDLSAVVISTNVGVADSKRLPLSTPEARALHKAAVALPASFAHYPDVTIPTGAASAESPSEASESESGSDSDGSVASVNCVERYGEGDVLKLFEAVLEDAGVPPSKMKYWVDEEYGSLQFETNGYLEGPEFQNLKSFTAGDAVGWDGSAEVNFVKSGDIGEVLE